MSDRYDHNLLIQSLSNLRPKSASLLAKTRNSMLKKRNQSCYRVSQGYAWGPTQRYFKPPLGFARGTYGYGLEGSTI